MVSTANTLAFLTLSVRPSVRLSIYSNCRYLLLLNNGHTVHMLYSAVACDVAGPLWLIMEFATHGNLRSYLRSLRQKNGSPALLSFAESAVASNTVNSSTEASDNSNPSVTSYLSPGTMFDYALQVSKGMEYLMSCRVGKIRERHKY